MPEFPRNVISDLVRPDTDLANAGSLVLNYVSGDDTNTGPVDLSVPCMPDIVPQPDFRAVVDLIRRSREAAFRAVNTHLIDLYWKIGEYISQRVKSENWGDAVVVSLADFIARTEPGAKGFSDKNLWRMRQFYEAYRDEPKLSTLLREISWSNNRAIMTRCKSVEEREFYLRLCK